MRKKRDDPKPQTAPETIQGVMMFLEGQLEILRENTGATDWTRQIVLETIRDLRELGASEARLEKAIKRAGLDPDELLAVPKQPLFSETY